MITIALVGKKLFSTLSFFKQHAALLRKIFGTIILGTALFLGYVSYFNPSFFAFSTTSTVVPKQKSQHASTNISVVLPTTSGLIDGLSDPYTAPPLANTGTWINSNPLILAQLKGKVVLIDFWTYSCINCIRTLPYLIAWDKTYLNKGLVIIGIHTPEFEFEKNANNVKQAVIHQGIQYSILLDNQYITWQNYHNRIGQRII